MNFLLHFENRYFTHQELHELFKWDPAALAVSETQQLLRQQHQQQAAAVDPAVQAHVDWIECQPLCAGTSEHGLLFSHQDPEGKNLQILQNPSSRNHQGSSAAALSGHGISRNHHNSSRRAAAASGAGSSRDVYTAAELGSMLSSLNIGPSAAGLRTGSSSSAGRSLQAAASSTAGITAQQQQQQCSEHLLGEVKVLQGQLKRVSADLAACGAFLPDGGSKVS